MAVDREISMRRPTIHSWLPLCVALCAAVTSAPAVAQLKTRNVVLIVSDGLRWQEVFTGADRSLLDDPKSGMWESAASLKKRFWDDSPAARRRLLMPFMWDVIAKQGQLFGNQEVGSIARVTNGVAYSYPGYNEMLTGHPDPRIDRTDIDGNNYGPNPNVTRRVRKLDLVYRRLQRSAEPSGHARGIQAATHAQSDAAPGAP